MSGFTFHCFNVGTPSAVVGCAFAGVRFLAGWELLSLGVAFFVLPSPLLLPPKKPPNKELPEEDLLSDEDAVATCFGFSSVYVFPTGVGLVFCRPEKRENDGDLFATGCSGTAFGGVLALGLVPNNEKVGDLVASGLGASFFTGALLIDP